MKLLKWKWHKHAYIQNLYVHMLHLYISCIESHEDTEDIACWVTTGRRWILCSLSLSYTHTHSVLRGISLYHMIYTYIVTMYMRKCIKTFNWIDWFIQFNSFDCLKGTQNNLSSLLTISQNLNWMIPVKVYECGTTSGSSLLFCLLVFLIPKNLQGLAWSGS